MPFSINPGEALGKWTHTQEDLDLLEEVVNMPTGPAGRSGHACKACGERSVLIDYDLHYEGLHLVLARLPLPWCLRCCAFAYSLELPSPAEAIADLGSRPLRLAHTGAYARSKSSDERAAKYRADFYIDDSRRLIGLDYRISSLAALSPDATAQLLGRTRDLLTAGAQVPLLEGKWKLSLSAYYGSHEHPRVLKVEPTQFCNLSCTFCPNPQLPVKHHLKLTQFQAFWKTVDPSEIVKVGFTGLGETLLNNDFWEMHKLVKGHDIRTSLVTNGSLLGRKGEALIRAGVDDVAVSLETLDERMHEAQRLGSRFAEVIDGIQTFSARSRGTNTHLHIICAMKRGTSAHAVDVVNFCKSVGLEPPKIYPVYERFVPGQGSIVTSASHLSMQAELARVREAVHDAYGHSGAPSREESLQKAMLSGTTYQDLSCDEPRHVFVLRADGSYAACNESIFDLEEAGRGRHGHGASVRKIWQSRFFKRRRLSLYMGKPTETCVGCNAYEIPATLLQ